MKLVIDTHVHTVASGHAYSTIEEVARLAAKEKLDMVAITDHSFKMPGGAHNFYFHNLKVLPEYIHGVRILRGVETNIIDYDGTIDLEEDELKQLDIVIASFHPPCISPADEQTITNAVIQTMQNPYVHIIGHPGDARYPMNFKEVVESAKKHHVLLEVNNASLKPTSFRIGVRENLKIMLQHCKEYEVPIVVGSDAHFSYDVGRFEETIELFKEIKFPEHLVMNTNPKAFMEFLQKQR